MKHISLFSGIGGFDLAAQWAGWTNIASCEINPFGRRHLEYYWPDTYHHDDIKTLTGSIIEHEAQKRYGPNWRADGVILSGGFPCQPYSLAGKRLGKEDDRHLWPEMLRVIREVKPDWIVGENVFGLVNWSDGLVFNEVQTDLEAEGYEVQSFVLPACATNAPHRRDRLWVVAYRNGNRRQLKKIRFAFYADGREWFTTNAANVRQKQPRNTRQRRSRFADCNSNAGRNDAYANDKGLQRSENCGGAFAVRQERNKQPAGLLCTDWKSFPTQSPVCTRNDGLSAGLDGITFPKWRNESIKAAGNAVVPQLVFKIFQTINFFTHGTQSTKRPEQQHAGKNPDAESWDAAGK